MQGQSECLFENNVVNDAYEYKWLTDELFPLKIPSVNSMNKGHDVMRETDIPSWLNEHVLGVACYGDTNLLPSFCRTYTEITKRQVLAVRTAVTEKTGYKSELFALIHPGGAVGERLNNKPL